MPFPAPPWHLQGQLWLSLFAVRSARTTQRPAGVYAAAFVDYQEGSVLTYRELLVARLVRRGGAVPQLSITDIWVDSPTSRDGGRSLWAIPKELAALDVEERRLGPVARTTWASRLDGTPVATGGFTSVPGAALRTPFGFRVAQRREDGTPVVAAVSGSARALPCLGAWRFGTDGPLAWLGGRAPLLSLRLTDFRIRFGG